MKKTSTPKKKSAIKDALGIFLVVVIVSGVLFGLLALTQCERTEPAHGGNTESGVTAENGLPTAVTDGETGIRYLLCPKGLGPEGGKDGDSPFMTCSYEGKELEFYKVPLEKTERYISLATANGYRLYRAESVRLPSIDSFGAVAAGIYMGDYRLKIDSFYYSDAVADESGAEDGTVYVNMITDAFSTSGVDKATGDWKDEGFGIRLYSAHNPGLYYEVDFKIDENGAEYLYDRVTGKLAKSPKALTARLMG
ncbi:MAG: hypothetical protein IKK83_01235 [Clostridia bacterium]|nr:hypothetical protein [Clostridia bacterium]